MRILSVHFHSHDTSVALVQDGKVLYAASNERFSRKKMDTKVPLKALENCLSYCKLVPEKLDKVVFVGDSFPQSFIGMFKEMSWRLILTKGKYLFLWKSLWRMFIDIVFGTGIPSFLYRVFLPQQMIKNKLKDYKGDITFIHHHMAHLYAAYYSSGWKNCLVVAIEGSGFDETMSIYKVINGVWHKIAENHLPHSAGKFYELVTEILGFNVLRHPGKITGLAAYGNPKTAYKSIKSLLTVDGLSIKLNYLTYIKWDIYYRQNKKIPPILQKYKREDIAAAFQRRLEECIVEITGKALRVSKMHDLVLTGGVTANVKLNQKLHELTEVENIYIHQAMGDDGLALGAALHVSYLCGYPPKRLDGVYLGPSYSDKEILKSINKNKLKYSKPRNLEKKIAELLTTNKVVARFNGRMEYGPRALGNRSILYPATEKDVNEWLNKRLKRAEFMPFAPVTLEEFADKCYKNLKGAEFAARFMTITLQCTPYMKKVSPAVVHVDGTARPQIIRKVDNPNYYKILKEYYKLTGIPSLINTSFNMHEEPIVCSPDDAIKSFLSGNLDYLAIGNYLIGNDNSKSHSS